VGGSRDLEKQDPDVGGNVLRKDKVFQTAKRRQFFTIQEKQS